MHPIVSTTNEGGDAMAKIKAALARIRRAEVYVGVPESDAQRTESGEMTNAGLMYLHTHGSPLQHIPARPVIEPALEAPDNRAPITNQLGDAARAALRQSTREATEHLTQAGMLARNACVRWFTDSRNGWAPDSPETVKRKGSDRPLIDTAQLRRSIDFLVDEDK